MRVSEHYRLALHQSELDFVDVDVHGDAALFVDPRALLLLSTPWGQECVSLIQDFFGAVLDAIHAGDKTRGRRLLGQLHEPNETRLGLSQGRAQGHALGDELSGRVFEALASSEAVQSRLLSDLEETILLIEGIGADLISDIATNVIRQPLIDYTQDAAADVGISLRAGVASGPMWDPGSRSWTAEYVDLPVADNRPLLLVPKIIVRRRMDYDPDEYFQHYILEQMQADEIEAGTSMVNLLKDGTPRVTKKALVDKYGKGKRLASRVTHEHPQVLERYRRDKRRQVQRPLKHLDFADVTGAEMPDWEKLLDDVVSVPTGNAGADDYHRAVQALLTALFYPDLTMPRREVEIHDGRKRIDITYANAATEGFFSWLAQHYPSAYAIIECKNYSGDPANPELDQLSGRFSPNRGRLGLLLCRSFTDKPLFVQRCRDTANDDRGFIIALDDDDLRQLVEWRKGNNHEATTTYLMDRFDELVM